MAHLDASGVTRLVADLKTRFAALAHTHAAASDITGQLPIANGGTGSSTAPGAVAALGAMTNSARTAFTNAMFASQLSAGCFMYAGTGSTLAAGPAEVSALSTDVFLLVDVYVPATDWVIQVVTEPATGREWSRQTRDGGTTWTSWMRIGVGNVLPVANGGTGAATASGARTNLDAAQDDSSGITLASAASNISTLLATTGIASTPSGKTLQGQISTLQDSVSNYVKIVNVTFPNTGTVSPNSAYGNTISVIDKIPSGYKLIGVTPLYTGDDGFVWVQSMLYSSNTSVTFQIRNVGSNADSGNPQVALICIRDL